MTLGKVQYWNHYNLRSLTSLRLSTLPSIFNCISLVIFFFHYLSYIFPTYHVYHDIMFKRPHLPVHFSNIILPHISWQTCALTLSPLFAFLIVILSVLDIFINIIRVTQFPSILSIFYKLYSPDSFILFLQFHSLINPIHSSFHQLPLLCKIQGSVLSTVLHLSATLLVFSHFFLLKNITSFGFKGTTLRGFLPFLKSLLLLSLLCWLVLLTSKTWRALYLHLETILYPICTHLLGDLT